MHSCSCACTHEHDCCAATLTAATTPNSSQRAVPFSPDSAIWMSAVCAVVNWRRIDHIHLWSCACAVVAGTITRPSRYPGGIASHRPAWVLVGAGRGHAGVSCFGWAVCAVARCGCCDNIPAAPARLCSSQDLNPYMMHNNYYNLTRSFLTLKAAPQVPQPIPTVSWKEAVYVVCWGMAW